MLLRTRLGRGGRERVRVETPWERNVEKRWNLVRKRGVPLKKKPGFVETLWGFLLRRGPNPRLVGGTDSVSWPSHSKVQERRQLATCHEGLSKQQLIWVKTRKTKRKREKLWRPNFRSSPIKVFMTTRCLGTFPSSWVPRQVTWSVRWTCWQEFFIPWTVTRLVWSSPKVCGFWANPPGSLLQKIYSRCLLWRVIWGR